MSAERNTVVFLVLAAEISFFSAILGAYLVLKPADAPSANVCLFIALCIAMAHLIVSSLLAIFRWAPKQSVIYAFSALGLICMMIAVSYLY